MLQFKYPLREFFVGLTTKILSMHLTLHQSNTSLYIIGLTPNSEICWLKHLHITQTKNKNKNKKNNNKKQTNKNKQNLQFLEAFSL